MWAPSLKEMTDIEVSPPRPYLFFSVDQTPVSWDLRGLEHTRTFDSNQPGPVMRLPFFPVDRYLLSTPTNDTRT